MMSYQMWLPRPCWLRDGWPRCMGRTMRGMLLVKLQSSPQNMTTWQHSAMMIFIKRAHAQRRAASTIYCIAEHHAHNIQLSLIPRGRELPALTYWWLEEQVYHHRASGVSDRTAIYSVKPTVNIPHPVSHPGNQTTGHQPLLRAPSNESSLNSSQHVIISLYRKPDIFIFTWQMSQYANVLLYNDMIQSVACIQIHALRLNLKGGCLPVPLPPPAGDHVSHRM